MEKILAAWNTPAWFYSNREPEGQSPVATRGKQTTKARAPVRPHLGAQPRLTAEVGTKRTYPRHSFPQGGS